MVWFGLAFVSLCTGLLRPSWWTALASPAVSAGLGTSFVVTEDPGYDMHGLGYLVGGVAAVICLAAWLIGRGLAALVRAWGDAHEHPLR